MFWKLQVLASPTRCAELTEVVGEDALSTSWFEVAGNNVQWCFEGLFAEQPAAVWLQSFLKGEDYKLEQLDDRDWVTENQAAFPPIDVGSFYIYGSHIQTQPPADKISLKIDAATAFGTGEHATTQGCLLLMDELHQDGHVLENILDLGCGTGVLGMAASRLFNQQGVLMSDNDIEATTMAAFNVRQNNLSDKLTVILSEGFSHSVLQICAPYDLIIANILAGPLISLASDMAKYTTPQSHVILSGILDHQGASVIEAYETQGLKLQTQKLLGEWVALLFRKV